MTSRWNSFILIMILKYFILFTLFLVVRVRGDTTADQWTSAKATPRDSYVKAAEHSTTLKGIEPKPYYGEASTFYYQIQPQIQAHTQQEYGQTKVNLPGNDYFGNELDEADAKVDPSSVTGLLSLAIGTLSSLSWIPKGILLIILAPILLPIILAPLIFIGLLFYFLPVIRIDFNPQDGQRSIGLSNAVKHFDVTARLIHHLSTNVECLERVSCELGRMTRGISFSNWIQSKLETSNNTLTRRVSRSFREPSSAEGSNCKKFTCNPGRQLLQIVKSYTSKMNQ